MPANLNKPFAESCCDGGECNITDMSAQSCGCDKRANWLCERHRHAEEIATSQAKPYITLLEVKLQGGVPYVSISPEILTGSSDIRDQALSLMQRLCNLDEAGRKLIIAKAEERAFSLESQVNELES